MTYQRDPDGRRRPADYVRRDDGSWNVLPIILGLLLLIGVGYFVFADRTPDGPTPVTNQPNTTTVPRTSPPTTPATPPATKPQ